MTCEFFLDGERVSADAGASLLQVVLQHGAPVPHLCYHPGLSVPASCRICVVGIGEGGERRLQTACNLLVEEGLVVDTGSADVLAARQKTLEFALLHHAVDCPSCSKAGECEVQNGVRDWGRERGRFTEQREQRPKRSLGTGLDLYPDRCVGCSRCIRFSEEISLSGELCRTGRGDNVEVDIAPGRQVDNPLAGNLADLCPAGALIDTSRVYGPPAWLLQGVDSICVRCSAGCPIRVDVYRGKVERVVARGLPSLGQYWICDEGRYGWRTGRVRLSQSRLQPSAGSWVDVSWERALEEATRRLKHLYTRPGQVVAFLNTAESNENNYLLARLSRELWQADRVGLLAHQTAEADQHFGGGFTVRADKAPNALGATEMIAGHNLDVAEYESLWEEMERGHIRAVYMFDGPDGTALSERAKKALSKVELLVVQGAVDSELAQMADVFFAGAVEFEKEGTYTNVDGRVQRLRRAIDVPINSAADWSMLVHLGAELGMAWEYAGIEDITAEIGERLQGRYAGFDYWDGNAEDRSRSAQAYGGGWATWLQRQGLLSVEDHTKLVRR